MNSKHLLISLLLFVLAISSYYTFFSSSETSLKSEPSTMSDHKSYIITLKETASDADVSSVKSKISEVGGVITSQFSLIKGFVAKLPSIHAESIGKNEHILAIEEDKEVHIQS